MKSMAPASVRRRPYLAAARAAISPSQDPARRVAEASWAARAQELHAELQRHVDNRDEIITNLINGQWQ